MIEALSPAGAALTSFGLRPWAGPAELDHDTVAEMLAAPPHEGVVPLLNAAVDAGAVTVPDDLVASMRSRWQDEMAAVVTLDCLLAELSSALRRGGIPTRVLKGVALASLDEVVRTWRRYGDVDVLVPSDRLLDAVGVLAPLGFHPVIEPVSNAWAARYAKSITLVDAAGTELDLHRQLAAGPFGSRVRSECLFEQGRPFDVGGWPVVALGDLHRFAHACYHAVLGGLTGPRHLRDIALVARAVSPEQLIAEQADGWSPTVVAIAVRRAEANGAACPPAWVQWATEWADDPDDARLVEAYCGSFEDLARAELAELRGPIAKVRYVSGLVMPSRAHLETRGEKRLPALAATRQHRGTAPVICASEVVRPGFVPVAATGIETAYLDGEAVLYDVAKARPILLNPTGSAVWMLIDGESTLEELTETLVEIFGADPAGVRADVDALVTRFGELGLLDGVDPVDDTPDASGLAPITGGPFPRPPAP